MAQLPKKSLKRLREMATRRRALVAASHVLIYLEYNGIIPKLTTETWNEYHDKLKTIIYHSIAHPNTKLRFTGDGKLTVVIQEGRLV